MFISIHMTFQDSKRNNNKGQSNHIASDTFHGPSSSNQTVWRSFAAKKDQARPGSEYASVEEQGIRTVLVVEDEPLNALFLKEVIRDTVSPERDVRVVHVTQGEQAIKLCRSQKIDLVLMDIRLPYMDGLQAARAIKTFNPSIPIIVETAYAFPEDRDRVFRSGCDDYMSKPISLSLLNQMLEKYLAL